MGMSEARFDALAAASKSVAESDALKIWVGKTGLGVKAGELSTCLMRSGARGMLTVKASTSRGGRKTRFPDALEGGWADFPP